jgi:hypothetical protein
VKESLAVAARTESLRRPRGRALSC